MNERFRLATTSSYRFGNLLFFLLMYLFASPFLEPYPSLAIIAHLLLSVSLCFAVYATGKHQHYRPAALTLLVPVLVLYWMAIYSVLPFGKIGAYTLLAIYFLLLILSFASQIARSRHITLNELYATLCLFLIIGLFWGALYALLYELSPGCYAGAMLDSEEDILLNAFNYFSMVTLTTLGYGDITPQTAGAGALSQLEAIVGQFYTAVIVAWLVGNFVTDRQRSR